MWQEAAALVSQANREPGGTVITTQPAPSPSERLETSERGTGGQSAPMEGVLLPF